jgi:homoserine O-acetyltransferase
MVGPGAAIDTRRYGVLSFDFIGGCGASVGADVLQAAGQALPITTVDQARAVRGLLTSLGIPRLDTWVGASYGGMVGLAFAERYPRRLGRLIAISAPDRSLPQAQALRHIQQSMARLGQTHDIGAAALDLARQLAMTTYRTPQEFNARFDQHVDPALNRDDVASYLNHCGQKFASRFTTEAFLCLSASIDTHHVDAGSLTTPVDLVGVDTDQLVPLAQLQRLARRIPNARLRTLASIYGHDAFLKESAAISRILTERLRDPA